MSTSTSGGPLRWALRGSALALAIGIGGYLVYQSHQQAQPSPAPKAVPPADAPPPTLQQAPAQAVEQRAAEEPTTRGAATAETAVETPPVFFHTSKAFAPGDPPPVPVKLPPERVLFHSSKSMAPPPILPPAPPDASP